MKLIGFAVFTSVFFLLGDVTLSAEPSPRDVWHRYVDGETAFGSVHTVVTKQPDGNYKYSVETRLLLDLLGQRSQITTNEQYVVKPNLQPVSVHKTTRQESGQIELTGRVEGNTLVLERNAYGVTRKRKIELSKNAIFRVCVPDWLKTRPDEELKTSVRVKGAGSRTEAVKMLSKRVFDHLNGGTLIPETLSGPEVLQCRKGKCSEFSTLFGSLARSLDIPTRIVLGDRMINGRWIGHMWNEVYVGRWITVDATTNEVGNVPALLKFVHADSVGGTQSLRWELTQSLDVSIAEFTMNTSKSKLALKTGIKGNVYTNADFRCRVAGLSENWKIVDKSKPGRVILRIQIPDHDDVQIHFVAYSLPLAYDAAVIIGLRHSRFSVIYKEYKVLQKKEQELNGRKWQTLQFTRDPLKTEQGRMKTTEYIWHKGSSGFLLNIIATEADHDRLEKDFMKIVKSFEVLDEKPQQAEKPH